MTEMELTATQQEHIDTLVHDAERKKVASQQLALDAARLLSMTQNRLEAQKDSGFLKRCWHRLCGKTGEFERANVTDLAEMQKYALHYLNALQEQNLLQARAIAVIRGNLQHLASAEAETRVVILKIMDRFNQRISDVETVSAIVDWRTSVTIAERGYTALPPTLQMLKVVFDYLAILQKNGIAYDKVEVRTDLEAAFSSLAVKYGTSLTLTEFVSSLVDDILDTGYEAFSALVDLRAGDTVIDAAFILQNVSGVGYNSLYHVAAAWPHIKYVEDRNQQKASLLKKLQAGDIDLDTEYTLIELAREILAGSQLAQDIYRETHPQLADQVQSSASAAPAGLTVQQLLANFVSIRHHSLLKTEPTPDERETYLESFALLCTETPMTDAQRSYLRAMARLFECADPTGRITALAADAARIRVDRILSVLSTPERQFIWLVDAVFLAGAEGQPSPQALQTIGQMTQVFNIKGDESAPFIEHASMLACDTDQARVIKAIRYLNRRCDQWKAILDFRKFSLAGAFRDARNAMFQATGSPQMKLRDEINDSITSSQNGSLWGNENFLQKAAIVTYRMTRVSSFNTLKKNIEAYGESLSKLLSDAKSVMGAFGYETPSSEVSLWSVKADDNTSASNQNWSDNMYGALEQLRAYLNDHDRMVNICDRALKNIEAGQWA